MPAYQSGVIMIRDHHIVSCWISLGDRRLSRSQQVSAIGGDRAQDYPGYTPGDGSSGWTSVKQRSTSLTLISTHAGETQLLKRICSNASWKNRTRIHRSCSRQIRRWITRLYFKSPIYGGILWLFHRLSCSDGLIRKAKLPRMVFRALMIVHVPTPTGNIQTCDGRVAVQTKH